MDNTENLLEETQDITSADIANMKVADLKRELKARGLSLIGNKPELMERLQSSLVKGFESLESADEVNEDEVLADVHLLSADDPKGHDISEDEILGSVIVKDDLEDSLGILNTKDIVSSPLSPVQAKTKITLSRGLSTGLSTVVTNKGSSEPSKKIAVICGPPKEDSAKENKETSSNLEKLSAEERLALRAKKFNLPLPTEEKLKIRSKRFGSEDKPKDHQLPVLVKGNSVISGTDVEKLKLRAERFGQILATDLKKAENTERMLKRKQRFGTLTSTSTVVPSANDEDRKKRRAERFENS